LRGTLSEACTDLVSGKPTGRFNTVNVHGLIGSAWAAQMSLISHP
jgi:hypothetical protein